MRKVAFGLGVLFVVIIAVAIVVGVFYGYGWFLSLAYNQGFLALIRHQALDPFGALSVLAFLVLILAPLALVLRRIFS